MTKITKILARQVLDSRGNPTVEAEVFTENNHAIAIVPSGASTGTHEALELRDEEKAFHGKGVLKAVANVGKIAELLVGKDVTNQKEIDFLMIQKDGTENKSRLGANAMLSVSMACARVAAKEKGMPLFRYLNTLIGRTMKLPTPFL
ncbi:MAG: phosphopyruvate hydratase, partial [Nanoarchaeota archaeon]|nr:phosphopyruvate hydratase [Nanoarchaeota archaeon]